jgi:PEP-CTERM motif
MLKRFIVASFAVMAAAGAFAQSTTLAANTTAVTGGADFFPGWRGQNYTFDMRGSTPTGTFWTGSEVSVDVVGVGSIYHSSNQRDPDGDPNTPIGDSATNNNLFPPTNPQPSPSDTSRYDTYMVAPLNATGGVSDPQFASPQPIVSSATRIRGRNPSGVEIPLAWFTLGQINGMTNALLARFTFTVAPGDELSLTQDATHPLLFATLVGRMTSNANPTGTNYSFNIYQTPEPGTLALLALGGLAGLLRRR